MHASTSVRQSVIKPRTPSNTSPKRPSQPVDISVNSSRSDGSPWSTVRTHFMHADRNRHKGHSPRFDITDASPPACICSPTTHQGSFRCRLHRESQTQWPSGAAASTSPAKSFLEDGIFAETRTSSSPGLRTPRGPAVTGFPAAPKNAATTPNPSASGPGKSEIPPRGVSAPPMDVTTAETSSLGPLSSPPKTSRFQRTAGGENLAQSESQSEDRNLN